MKFMEPEDLPTPKFLGCMSITTYLKSMCFIYGFTSLGLLKQNVQVGYMVIIMFLCMSWSLNRKAIHPIYVIQILYIIEALLHICVIWVLSMPKYLVPKQSMFIWDYYMGLARLQGVTDDNAAALLYVFANIVAILIALYQISAWDTWKNYISTTKQIDKAPGSTRTIHTFSDSDTEEFPEIELSPIVTNKVKMVCSESEETEENLQEL